MAGRKVARKSASTKATPAVVHHISALLHTMRCIDQHEQQLCTLMHEISSTGVVSTEVSEELRILLDEMPSRDYTDDLEAIRDAVSQPAPSSATRLTAKHSDPH